MRDERCRACGRPTSVGEDFDGPCVYDSDLECAIAQRNALQDDLSIARGYMMSGVRGKLRIPTYMFTDLMEGVFDDMLATRTLLDRWWRAETEDGPVLYDSAAEARAAKGRIGRVVCVSRYRVTAR